MNIDNQNQTRESNGTISECKPSTNLNINQSSTKNNLVSHSFCPITTQYIIPTQNSVENSKEEVKDGCFDCDDLRNKLKESENIRMQLTIQLAKTSLDQRLSKLD